MGSRLAPPVGDGAPAPELMRFIESADPHWSRSRLAAMHDKVVTCSPMNPSTWPRTRCFTRSTTRSTAGNRDRRAAGFELEIQARAGHDIVEGSSRLSASRLRSALYRAYRLARLASVLADERHRKERLMM